MGYYCDGNISVVNVRKRKTVRIRPACFNWKYDKKKLNI